MLLRRFGTFSGGIDLPEDKSAALASWIVPAGRLRRLCVPLAPVDGPAARPIIQPGAWVSRAERIARAEQSGQVDVFAPLAGRYAGLTEVVLPGRSEGTRRCQAMELTDLDEPTGILPLPLVYSWQEADEASLPDRLAEGALTTMRHPVVPLTEWIAAAADAKVDTLIANVMDNTPYATADHRLLAEFGMDVIRGLAILARAIGTDQVALAVDNRRTGAYRSSTGPARYYRVQPIALAHKYPIGNDTILIKVLTRREVPLNGGSLDVGVAVTDAATCRAAYRWVACGERQTARVVTVAGPRASAPGNYLLPFGAEVSEALEAAGVPEAGPVVDGSVMTGRQVGEGAVVHAAAGELVALPETTGALPTPCIRCGWCSDNCPARLNVAALNDDFELGRARRAGRRGAMSCVGCGICTYVCPARLPLAWRVSRLKGAIRHEDRPAPAGAKGD